ncbi:hypothetical protein BDZ89DRAFT_1056013 [Hymenopellis radicata]|nr:hypothetical protein BDZ89DRAFT_1056013 [Hymenopellis radicata]
MPNQTTIQVSNFYKANCEAMGLKEVAARASGRSSSPDREKVASVLNTSETDKLPFHYMPIPMPPNAAGIYSLAHLSGPIYAPPPGMYMHPAYGPPYPPYVNFPSPPNAPPNSRSSNPVPSNAS